MPTKVKKNINTFPFAAAGTLPVYLVPYWNVLFKRTPKADNLT